VPVTAPSIQHDASGILRSMIERIKLTPEASALDGCGSGLNATWPRSLPPQAVNSGVYSGGPCNLGDHVDL